MVIANLNRATRERYRRDCDCEELENIFTHHFVAPHCVKKVDTPYIYANFVPN